MSSLELRFCKDEIHYVLNRQSEAVADAVRSLVPDVVLSVPVLDIAERIFEEFKVEPLSLRTSERSSNGATDVQFRVDGWSGDQIKVDGTRVEVCVPFDGDAVLFDVKASAFNFNPPRFEVRGRTVVVSYEGRSPIDKEQAKVAIERLLQDIEKHLSWQRNDIDPWNKNLRLDLPTQIESRRNKVLQDRELEAFLEVPIVGRSKPAPSFSVDPPKSRRPILVPALPNSPAFAPEPAISDDGFGAILDELESVTNAVQRLPRTFATMPEESLRDVLLVVLNNRFGPASGETFSRKGKTDIFVLYGGDDRAVFIAECKWWTGPKAFSAAIGQLLGYLTWRDSRASLIVFVKSGNPSEIADKAIEQLKTHASFKRLKHIAGRDTFTLANPEDLKREIHLALLVIPVIA